eukprot:4803531-Amphidinium_carterae.1
MPAQLPSFPADVAFKRLNTAEENVGSLGFICKRYSTAIVRACTRTPQKAVAQACQVLVFVTIVLQSQAPL